MLMSTNIDNSRMMLVSQVCGLEQHRSEIMNKIINPWHATPDMVRITQISTEKAKLTSPIGSLLHLAAYAGDDKTVISLLQAGADPNVVEPDSHRTPLHLAAQSSEDQPSVITILLAHPTTNPNPVTSSTSNSYAPIHYAAQYGHDKSLQAFLANTRVNGHAHDQNGNSILHLAAEAGQAKVLTTLLRHPDMDVIAFIA